MKKHFMYIRTYLLMFAIACVILILLPSQTNKTNTKPPITDTTAIISKVDVISFNIWLKQAASFDQYSKLSPEQVTIELLNWKTRELTDTTKRK